MAIGGGNMYGGLGAPGGDEMLRRRRGAPGAGGGYEGLGGPQVTANSLASLLGGVHQWDFSGAMGRDFGRGGLASLMAGAGQEGGRGLSGPALRHFANQGFDFGPPGLDQRNAVGGPNIAPGNIENAQALDQPMGNEMPGVPRGVGFGVQPGRVAPAPQTQGWRNVHPGYSAAAQFGYGTPDFEGRLGRAVGAPGAQEAGPPGAISGQGGGPGGGGGGGGAPASQNAVGGGGSAVAPGAGPGAGQGSAGGASSGGKQTGGGGQPAGVTPSVQQQARRQPTARGGFDGDGKGGGYQGGIDLYHTPALGNIAPNKGNNNTPSETRGPINEGKFAGMSAKEKAAAKADWQSRVAEKKARAAEKSAGTTIAPLKDQSGYGEVQARGSGTAPIAGKTKPKGRGSTSAQQR